jgi:GntR family transcriptional regulator, transcriptional repressor for pyruvate dehydrogenase complex
MRRAGDAAAFAPLAFEPNYRRVASAIEARILDRTLRNGDALPPELELAAQFDVTRSTVREALRELESLGLVERRRGTKRMVVTRPDAGRVADRVGNALALADVTVREVWEALTILEPPTADAAARRRTPASLARIAAAVERFEREQADTPAAVEGVGEFFRAVAAASGNRVLALTQEPLLLLLQQALQVMIDRVPQARGRIHSAQRRLLGAIEVRDAEAARTWMTKHVRDFRRGFEVAGIDLDTPVPPLGGG